MFEEELIEAVSKKASNQLFEFMERNIEGFFSTPDIPKYYQLLKELDFASSETLLPRLIMAWMAFVSGEHAHMFALMQTICETDLSGADESSLFYSLRAMGEWMAGSNEGLKYAKLSVDVLSDEEGGFYLANAKLTYGQLLSQAQQYRAAAEMFAASAHLFFDSDLSFLAAVAVANEALNLYKLGELASAIDKCTQALVMGSSFRDKTQPHLGFVHLPLGMCYYEMGKPHLAIKHLELAKSSIDQSDLFHMHGLLEFYLFKAYYLSGNLPAMKALMNETTRSFEHMHYRHTNMLISFFRVFLTALGEAPLSQADIERLELEYLTSGADSHSMAFEPLVLLQLKGYVSIIKISDLEVRLERLRYLGFIPQLQLTLLQLAELHWAQGSEGEAARYLKEAVELFHEYRISANFHVIPLATVELIQGLDRHLYQTLASKPQTGSEPTGTLLTAKEKEVMQLVAQGMTNKEISQELFVSVGTVKWHINNIFSKLNVKNRIKAVEKAKRLHEI